MADMEKEKEKKTASTATQIPISKKEQEQDKAAIIKAMRNFYISNFLSVDDSSRGQVTPGQICMAADFHKLKLPSECDKYLKPTAGKK